jgi:hypothetical protein
MGGSGSTLEHFLVCPGPRRTPTIVVVAGARPDGRREMSAAGNEIGSPYVGTPAAQAVFAGTWRRLGGWVIDYLIVSIAAIIRRFDRDRQARVGAGR